MAKSEPKVGRIVRNVETSSQTVENAPRITTKAARKVPMKISDCSSAFAVETRK